MAMLLGVPVSYVHGVTIFGTSCAMAAIILHYSRGQD